MHSTFVLPGCQHYHITLTLCAVPSTMPPTLLHAAMSCTNKVSALRSARAQCAPAQCNLQSPVSPQSTTANTAPQQSTHLAPAQPSRLVLVATALTCRPASGVKFLNGLPSSPRLPRLAAADGPPVRTYCSKLGIHPFQHRVQLCPQFSPQPCVLVGAALFFTLLSTLQNGGRNFGCMVSRK